MIIFSNTLVEKRHCNNCSAITLLNATKPDLTPFLHTCMYHRNRANYSLSKFHCASMRIRLVIITLDSGAVKTSDFPTSSLATASDKSPANVIGLKSRCQRTASHAAQSTYSEKYCSRCTYFARFILLCLA
jgi:hypothetical protein